MSPGCTTRGRVRGARCPAPALLPLPPLPLLVALPHMRERLAERGVEIAIQARERAVLCHVDAHLRVVPQAFAHVDLHDLADHEAPLRADFERGVVAAFEE